MTRLAEVARPVGRAFFTPIIRPRVLQRIEMAAFRTITLIVAPAGYGKSVALSHWLQSKPQPYVRFNVQAEHGTLLGFARGLAEAFSLTLPALLNTVSSAYKSSSSSSTPGQDMARWMASHVKRFQGVIAIDDFHRGRDDLEISRFVAYLISETKQQTRWIIATRSTLDLPVATWLAYGDLNFVVDDSDLTFSNDEVLELAEGSSDPPSSEALASIAQATSGWPVALGLALRSSSSVPASTKGIASSTREMLFQYLAEQVYSDLSMTERDVLHFASYLPAVDVSVLLAAGYVDCGATLEAVRKRVTFLSLERLGIYRCHDLFRDFLHRQLNLVDPRHARHLQLEAAEALERVGNIAAALRLYSVLHAVNEVLRVLQAQGFDLIDHSHSDVVEFAIRQLHQSVRTQDATVLGLRAQREADAGRFDRAQGLFEKAVRNAPNATLVATLSIRLAISVMNQGRSIAEILEPLVGTKSASLRAEIFGLLAADYALRGYAGETASAIGQAECLGRELDDDAVSAKVSLRTAVAGMNIGLPIARVRNSAITASELAESVGLIVLAGRAFAVLATASLFLENNLTDFVHYARMALDRATQSGDRFNLETALFQLACAETQSGSEASLGELIDRLAGINHPTSGRDGVLHSLRATLFAWRGEPEDADRLMDLFASDGYSYYDFDQMADRAVHSMYSLAAGHRTKALAISTDGAKRLRSLRPTHAYARSQCEIAGMLFALVQILANRRASGRQSLVRILARPCNIATRILGRVALSILSFKDPNEWEEAASSGLTELGAHGLQGLATSIRRCVKLTADRVAKEDPNDCELTPAELRVMRAIDQGQSTKEIADATGRSPHTVRTLAQRAAAKLGCSGRQEALSMLRRRGFLSDPDFYG